MAEPIHWVSNPEAIAALQSAARQRLLDRLEAIGPASAAEIAEGIGVEPDRVYYHLKKLETVGLVAGAGARGEGRTREALWDLAHRRWHLAYDAEDPKAVGAIDKLTAAMLRQAQRDFGVGWTAPSIAVAGRRRTQWSLRLEGRLDADQLGALNGHLQAIVDLVREARHADATGRKRTHVALTWVLASLDGEAAR